MNCSRCATPIPPDGLFCPQCGERMVIPTPPPMAPSPSTPFPVQPWTTPETDNPMLPPPTHQVPRRRERRRERRRRAQGFWYAPLVNLLVLALTAAGWYFIPSTILAYLTDVDFSSLMAQAAKGFQYYSARDVWETYESAFLALALAAVLLIITIMAFFAIYRLVRRGIVVSRRKKEWKQEKRELLRRELSEQNPDNVR